MMEMEEMMEPTLLGSPRALGLGFVGLGTPLGSAASSPMSDRQHQPQQQQQQQQQGSMGMGMGMAASSPRSSLALGSPRQPPRQRGGRHRVLIRQGHLLVRGQVGREVGGSYGVGLD
jgi:hypothetical protein